MLPPGRYRGAVLHGSVVALLGELRERLDVFPELFVDRLVALECRRKSGGDGGV